MSLGLPYRAQHAWRAKGRKVGGRDQSRPPERPKLVVPRTVIPELAAGRPRRAHGRVHVDVVAVRIGPQPRHQGGVREGARPDDAVLVAGGRRQRLHDRARHALWRKMDVGGDDRPRRRLGRKRNRRRDENGRRDDDPTVEVPHRFSSLYPISVRPPKRGDRALAHPGHNRQPTVTVVCIQGWMRHSKRWIPGESGDVVTVSPGETVVAAKAPPGNPAHSGTGVSPSRALTAAMQPPPKSATSVNVWSSPPRLWAASVPPASRRRCPGAKRQAGARPCARSCATNSENVVVPSFTHVPGPSTALKVAASQSSSAWTCLDVLAAEAPAAGVRTSSAAIPASVARRRLR